MRSYLRLIAWIAAVVLFGSTLAVPTRAADAQKISVGLVGSPIPFFWPLYIAMQKGYLKDEGIDVDITYAQSSAAVIQQLTAQSLDLTVGVGMVDPIRAIDNGAPLAILRVVIKAPPYDLLGDASLNGIRGLKGKIISVGGPKDVTRLYVDNMLAAFGLQDKDVDYVYAGFAGARFAALKAKAVSAAILPPPFTFYATAAGFKVLGHAQDYNKNLPFLGGAVQRQWAKAHPELVRKFLTAFDKAVAFFNDPANRKEAIDIMAAAATKMKRSDIEGSYDYFFGGKYFVPSSVVSKKELANLLDAMRKLNDLPQPISVDKLVLPGVTQIGD